MTEPPFSWNMAVMRIPILSGLIITALSILTPLQAQNIVLDEGAFRLYLNGDPAGREEFSIRRIGMGSQARVILRGSVEMEREDGDLSLAPALDARGPEMAVATYQIKAQGAVNTQIYLGLTDSRYQSRVISSAGEQLREFRAGPGSVLLDRGVAHHHYLLTPHLDETGAVSLTVLSPRDGLQTRMTLTFLGTAEIQVADRLHSARHFRLEGSESTRDVWLDEQNRVLAVEIPDRGYRAERESFS